MSLYCAYLYDRGIKSSTIKSYISAIKSYLIADNYQWDDNKVILAALTRSCRLRNDQVINRLPIQLSLLELFLVQIQERYPTQPYLEAMYKAFFSVAYYGLMRIGELANSQHALKACDIHVADNKRKMLLVLYSSKTHGNESPPQQIKITARDESITARDQNAYFCPFQLTRDFLSLRGDYRHIGENLFVFSDGTPVTATQVRSLLREILQAMGLDASLYDTHSFRIGRATNMMKHGYSFEQIKHTGRWRSNAVYKYIRNC